MYTFPKAALARFWIIFVFAPACALAATPQQTEGAASGQTATILRLTVLGNRNEVEIEIDASQQITPQTRVLTEPDRLVIDEGAAKLSNISLRQHGYREAGY